MEDNFTHVTDIYKQWAENNKPKDKQKEQSVKNEDKLAQYEQEIIGKINAIFAAVI